VIAGLRDKVLDGKGISKDEAFSLSSVQGAQLFELFSAANRIREKFRDSGVELCSIINAKSGECPEDCSYCAQSSYSDTDAPVFPLVKEDAVMEKVIEARDAGVKRFCIVTSGKKIGNKELRAIASMVAKIRKTGILPCATLGLLSKDEIAILKDNGLERYHHNLETSERFFPEMCTTHTYQDKLKTIEDVQSLGLSLCSGGIFGIGEEWQDRIEMAFALKKINPDSVPVNFLIAVRGTPLEDMDLLPPFEALKIISIYRFILPDKEIRICGGRRQVLREFNSMVFMAGADSLLTGNYLTTTGTAYEDDLNLIKHYGLNIKQAGSEL
jgi:biotin synthase